MRKYQISSAIRTAFAAAALLAAALFPATASACVAITWRAPPLSFWDARPYARDQQEVVLKVRLVRSYLPDPTSGDGRCDVSPAVFVFDVIEVAEGSFEPRQIYLYGSGTPRGETGWLVGKPATLYMKNILHIAPREDGESITAEHPSIEWRPPPCPDRFDCRPPNLRVLQP